MRAATYSRFSTDKQRDTSIADQRRICQGRAETEGWTIVAHHSDEGISGTTPIAGRPGGAALLADALAGRFDVLILEGLDRLSRDLVEQETVVRRVEHRGIRIVGVSDGYDSTSGARKLHRGMRGLVNELFVDDLRAKTHRGLAGQVARGFAAGGAAYGYRSIPQAEGSRLEIEPAAADWVRWIFRQYSEGWSCQRIAGELNRLRIPSPRGGTWAVSALYGSPAKGSGLLNNELYIGRYTWNRSQWVKDPDTGRRQRLDRPRAEWQVVERPELRIVTDGLWQAARERIGSHRLAGGGQGRGKRPSTLFGGLLTCGQCGGPLIAVNARAYGCAWRKDRGPAVCAGVLVRRDVVEQVLATELREALLAPEALAELHQAVEQISRDLAAVTPAGAAKARLRELQGEIDRLTDAIAQMGLSQALRERLANAEAEQRTLQTQSLRKPPARPDAAEMVRRYRSKILGLQTALREDRERARRWLKDLLGTVRVERDGEGVFAVLEMQPAALMAAGGVSLDWVAGAGFEPTTFGL